ncbi:MAG: bifunctional oligoribonuclease/PAP phosphatase NrnA [Spirochaetales bacterium]|nr:bifunctional oligoribonuclease/PAP phosphatase NrnA [Spirochaetales bacterium]
MTFSEIPSCIREGFNSYKNFIVIGHEQPDADCLCSQLGLAALLKRLGKNVRLIAKGPFTRPETRDLEPLFETSWSYPSVAGTLLILLDCSDISRTGYPAEELEPFDLMIIDHHAAGSSAGKYRYIDAASPSTTLLIQGLWDEYGEKPDAETSSYLFFGFATDTGFFRHLEGETGPVFHRVAEMIDNGASPNAIYRRINSGRELGTRRLMGRLLERARFHCGNRILISWENKDDREELGVDDRDSDRLYQLLQSVAGCEAVALIREESETLCIVGLRSNNHIDVGRIASELGGGGHVKAAGCAVESDRDTVTARVLELFKQQL